MPPSCKPLPVLGLREFRRWALNNDRFSTVSECRGVLSPVTTYIYDDVCTSPGSLAMQTKLTLRLDDELIERAKQYAQRTGRSVSQIVADYFALLDKEFREGDDVVTPIVSSMRGALTEVDVDVRAVQRELLERGS